MDNNQRVLAKLYPKNNIDLQSISVNGKHAINSSNILIKDNIKIDKKTIGSIYLQFSTQELQNRIGSTKKYILILGLLLFILGAGILIILQRVVTRPLDDIIDTVYDFNKGQIKRRIEVSSQDEFKELEVILNDLMENAIRAREVQKQKRTDLDKNNISRQLRTQLNDVIGIINHIHNNPTLSREEIDENIKIAQKAADELHQLIIEVLIPVEGKIDEKESIDKQRNNSINRQYNYKVLVVDDIPTNLKVASLTIGNFGCKISTASNGQDAIDQYESDQHDIIFMDINMPIMDGSKATKLLKEKHPYNPPYLIGLSANAMLEDKKRFKEIGMDDYICKPIQQEDILRALETFKEQTMVK